MSFNLCLLWSLKQICKLASKNSQWLLNSFYTKNGQQNFTKRLGIPDPPPFPFKYHLGIILTFWHCFPLLCDQNAYEGIPCPWCILAESCKFWLRATNICFLSITAAPWPSLPFWQDYTCCPLPLSRKIAFYFREGVGALLPILILKLLDFDTFLGFIYSFIHSRQSLSFLKAQGP